MSPPNELSIPAGLLHSLSSLLTGYSLAVIGGVPVGAFIGLNKIVYQILKRVLLIPAAFPAIVLIPTALMIFQSNQPIILPLVIHSAVWLIAIYSATAVHIFRQQRNLSAAIASLSTGLRIGMAMAWLTVIVIEFVASGLQGIGFMLWDAYQNADVKNITNATIAIGVVGFLLDQIIDLSALLVSWLISKHQASDAS
jgi:ABC-type nitrate/sulfonate/bicarbonate transport system permease component